MKQLQRTLGLSLLLLLAGITAFGQTTATLSGTVTTDGGPLPGATITISSPALQGTRTTVSGINGGYVFPALPPGDYAVTIALEGMQTVTKKVHLSLSTTATADADLKLSAVTEAITVTASSPAVLDTPQVSANVSSKLVDDLPLGRTVLAAADLAPGVNSNTVQTNQLSISGSPGYDNLVMVNGVSITENVRNQTLALFIEDAIQETTVLTGAISAEYGRFTGGVVNSITKTGGNEFSGSFRDSLSNNSWTNKTPYAGEADHLDKINSIYEATLGGFVMRDRLWFFGAGRKQSTSSSAETYRTNIPYATSTDAKRWEAKLTGQITPKHSIVGSYLKNDSTSTNTRFTSSSYDLNSLSDRKDPQSLLSAHYNGIITNNFLVEGHYSQRKYDIAVGNGAQYTDLLRGTLIRNAGDGLARFNSPTFCGVCDTESRNSDGYTVKGNYFLSTAGTGAHNFVAGYERFDQQRYANNHQSGSDYRMQVTDVVRVPGSTTPLMSPEGLLYPVVTNSAATSYLRWTPIFVGANQNHLGQDSLFVNDRWDLSHHWSFNVGLRYDKNDAKDGQGNQVSKDSAISPRLSATYDIQGNGRHRVQASYNEYVTMVGEGPGTSADAAGSPGTIDYIYGGPAINAPGTPQNELLDAHQALQMIFDWFFANGGTSNTALLKPNGAKNVPGYDYVIDSNLKSPKVTEYVLGYGVQLGRTAYAKADFVSRDWKDFYAFRIVQGSPIRTDFLGIEHDVATVYNTDDIKRQYRGVQLQAAWRPNRFNTGLNYTWSKLRGNDTQESASSGTVGNTTLTDFYPEYLGFKQSLPIGYLAGDQRHRARMWVGYDVPMPEMIGTLNVSLLQNYGSGLPYSAAATIDAFSYPGAPNITSYAESQLGYPVYYFSGRGAYRTDTITSTDLSFNYGRKIAAGVQLFAQAEMFNIFDESGVTNVNTTVYTSLNSQCKKADGTRCSVFNPFTDTPVEGVNYVKGPNFGKPTAASYYQTPFSYRFSLGLRF
ncbi:MAG: TonB-dependent receptor [Thermoanaerobaculia bacterium]